MKTHRSKSYVHIDLTLAEARVLLEELSDVRGGSHMPKIRQVCAELASSLSLLNPISPVSRAATELGRLGGLKGGHARAAALSPGERSSIAKKAAEKRWGIRVGGDPPSADVDPEGESE